jgi:predicted HAD superfamily phosphohydrolase YqeG
LKAIISDADNTFGPYGMEKPTERFVVTMRVLGHNGIRLFSGTNIYGKDAIARKENFDSMVDDEGRRLIEATITPADVTPPEFKDEPEKFAKPRPDMFLKILDDYGLQPEEVLVIGDQKRSDVRAAHAAGLEAVQVVKHGKKDHKWVRFNRPFESFGRLIDGYAFSPEQITRTSDWAKLSFATRALIAARQRRERHSKNAKYIAPIH